MKSALFFFSLLLACITLVWAQSPSTNDASQFTQISQLPNQANVNPVAVDIQIPAEARKPVVMNFDRVPASPWIGETCEPLGTCDPPFPTVATSHGILSIDSPVANVYSYALPYPDGIWHKYVSNKRGWVVETSLQVDPLTMGVPGHGTVIIWIHDHSSLVIFGFNRTEVLLEYPDQVSVPMNTTDSFHIYRMEGKGNRVRLYVDGRLTIDHTLRAMISAGTVDLLFGDGDVAFGRSVSRWDYFSYEVFPDPPVRF